jgi:GDPmannose 4,6-dehydratase
VGDASKAKEVLGWEPQIRFCQLVDMMVDADLQMLEEKNNKLELLAKPISK